MMQWLLTFALCMIANFSAAANLRVQTGEHATFSRVVISMPITSEWIFGRVDDGYSLRLNEEATFNLDQFFDLIPRDRIKAVRQNQASSELVFAVDCDCNADVFELRPSVLVIDIRDGTPAPNSPFEVPFVVSSKIDLSIAPQITTLLPSSPQPTPQDVTALSRAVRESLGRGLRQGLLEPSAPSDLVEPLAQFDAAQPGLRVLTSTDQDSISIQTTPVTQQGDACLPDAYFAIADWGDDRLFSTQMNEHRTALTGEFDKLNSSAVKALARLYVYFGFGREALQTLAMDGVQSQERTYLSAIAAIIDGDQISDDLFYQEVSCATPVALWAMLARSENGLGAMPDRKSILMAFNALPFHLQTHLGPLLSDQMLMIGDTDGATQVLNARRVSPDNDGRAKLAEVAVTGVIDGEVAAITMLDEMVDTDPYMEIDAMIQLLQTSTVNNLAISEDTFLSADAIRFEYAEGGKAKELLYAQVEALIAMNSFAQARSLLDVADGMLDAQMNADLRLSFAKQSVANMEDLSFLELALADPLIAASPEIQNIFEARLVALGMSSTVNDPKPRPVLQTIFPQIDNRIETLAPLAKSRDLLTHSQDTRLFVNNLLQNVILNSP